MMSVSNIQSKIFSHHSQTFPHFTIPRKTVWKSLVEFCRLTFDQRLTNTNNTSEDFPTAGMESLCYESIPASREFHLSKQRRRGTKRAR
jgi:hypothetical protein